MAKKLEKKPKKEKQDKNTWSKARPDEPWVSKSTGLIVVTLASIGMAVLTMTQTVPALGWVEGVLWGLGFGAAVWVVFVGFYYFSRWLRGNRN